MNKKLWSRLLLVGVLSTSLLAVAGCGDSEADRQAQVEKSLQQAREQQIKLNTERADKASKAEVWSKALAAIKEKGELKGAPIQVSGTMSFNKDGLNIDVVKPGTTELLRYTYDLDKQTWSDGEPVNIVGPGKKDIARTFYPIDNLNPTMMAAIIEKFKQEATTNPELKDSYYGFFTKAGMGWGPRSQKMYYYVEMLDMNVGEDIIESSYDADGNITELKVKPKGSKDRKVLIGK